MRILVIGANGQVGHELLRALHEQRAAANPPLQGEGMGGDGVRGDAGVIIPVTRSGRLPDGGACESLDLADKDALRDALARIQPDLILNAAAYTAVDRAEDEPDLAQRINAEALDVIGAWSARHGARVVHYSTDYVFDGSATRPYREDDATHPVGAYGRSKLAGEIALRDSGARHLLFRTAWVYAARGHNFLRTMLRLGAERDALRVVDDQIGAPTPARLIADVTAQVIAQWYTPPSAGRGSMRSIGGMRTRDGVYHLAASGRTSWCGFARAIFERAQRTGLIEHAPTVHAIRTVDYATRAARPAFSVLDTTRLRDTFGIVLPAWETALDGVMRELETPRS